MTSRRQPTTTLSLSLPTNNQPGALSFMSLPDNLLHLNPSKWSLWYVGCLRADQCFSEVKWTLRLEYMLGTTASHLSQRRKKEQNWEFKQGRLKVTILFEMLLSDNRVPDPVRSKESRYFYCRYEGVTQYLASDPATVYLILYWKHYIVLPSIQTLYLHSFCNPYIFTVVLRRTISKDYIFALPFFFSGCLVNKSCEHFDLSHFWLEHFI